MKLLKYFWTGIIYLGACLVFTFLLFAAIFLALGVPAGIAEAITQNPYNPVPYVILVLWIIGLGWVVKHT